MLNVYGVQYKSLSDIAGLCAACAAKDCMLPVHLTTRNILFISVKQYSAIIVKFTSVLTFLSLTRFTIASVSNRPASTFRCQKHDIR